MESLEIWRLVQTQLWSGFITAAAAAAVVFVLETKKIILSCFWQFRIRTAPHDVFRREGNDLHTTVTITLVNFVMIDVSFTHTLFFSFKCSMRWVLLPPLSWIYEPLLFIRFKLLLVSRRPLNILMNIWWTLARR
jgi:hypothetical protein